MDLMGSASTAGRNTHHEEIGRPPYGIGQACGSGGGGRTVVGGHTAWWLVVGFGSPGCRRPRESDRAIWRRRVKSQTSSKCGDRLGDLSWTSVCRAQCTSKRRRSPKGSSGLVLGALPTGRSGFHATCVAIPRPRLRFHVNPLRSWKSRLKCCTRSAK